MYGVADTSHGLVAVGSMRYWTVDDEGVEVPVSFHPAVWISDDGITWERTWEGTGSVVDSDDVFYDDISMDSVIEGPDGLLVAVGATLDENGEDIATVWTSVDGRQWERIEPDNTAFTPGTVMLDVALGEHGYVAVGTEDGTDAAIWQSPDGATWARIDTAVASIEQAILAPGTAAGAFNASTIEASADVVPDPVDAASDVGVQVVFIDANADNVQQLIDGIDPSYEIHVIDANQDGVAFMASILDGRSGSDAVHVISHGQSGQLQLGNAMVDAASIADSQAHSWSQIGGSLADAGDILIYGCDFGEGRLGSLTVEALSQHCALKPTIAALSTGTSLTTAIMASKVRVVPFVPGDTNCSNTTKTEPFSSSTWKTISANATTSLSHNQRSPKS